MFVHLLFNQIDCIVKWNTCICILGQFRIHDKGTTLARILGKFEIATILVIYADFFLPTILVQFCKIRNS